MERLFKTIFISLPFISAEPHHFPPIIPAPDNVTDPTAYGYCVNSELQTKNGNEDFSDNYSSYGQGEPSPGATPTQEAQPIQYPPTAKTPPPPTTTPVPTYEYYTTPPPTGLDTDVGADAISGFYNFVSNIVDASNHGISAYKVKNLLPGDYLEAAIMGGVQLYADADNNLNVLQRIARAGIVGLESYGIDKVSTGAGAVGFLKAGPVGYFAASAVVGTTLDEAADWVNSIVFPLIGLGDY